MASPMLVPYQSWLVTDQSGRTTWSRRQSDSPFRSQTDSVQIQYAHSYFISCITTSSAFEIAPAIRNQLSSSSELLFIQMSYNFVSSSKTSALSGTHYQSCSPPLPLPSPPKYCGLRLAVSNTPAVMNTPAINRAWASALMPKATTLPTHMLKMIHHIHASTCITMCRVFMSGIV